VRRRPVYLRARGSAHSNRRTSRSIDIIAAVVRSRAGVATPATGMGSLAPSSPRTATSRSTPAISRPLPWSPELPTTTARPAPLTKQTDSQRNPEWQSNVNGRLAPDATGKTDRPLVGASPAHTAVTRSTKSTTRTFPRYAGSSPSAARSARAGSRERAAAIRARSRARSSARASLRCCRTSPRAGASAGNAASGPAVARAETGSGPERTASRGTHGLGTSRNPTTPGSASSSRSRPGLPPLGRPLHATPAPGAQSS